MVRKSVPADLSNVETKRLAGHLTTSTEAILGAMEAFAVAPAGSVGTDRLSSTRKLNGRSRRSMPVMLAKRDQLPS